MEPDAGAGDSDDAPIGPGAEEEAFIASEQLGAPAPRESSAPPRRDEPPHGRLEDFVARIPEATRKSLHDLLRAKFTRVRRLRDGELR